MRRTANKFAHSTVRCSALRSSIERGSIASLVLASLVVGGLAIGATRPASAQDAGPRRGQIDAGPRVRRARPDAGWRRSIRRAPIDALDAGPTETPPGPPNARTDLVDASWLGGLDGGVPLGDGALPFDDAAIPNEVPDAGPPDAGPDAGPPDAGPPDAGSPRVAPPEPASSEWMSTLSGLLFERAERAEREAQRAQEELARRSGQPVPTTREPAASQDVPVRIVGCDASPAVLGLDFPEHRISGFGLVLLVLLTLLALYVLDRVRRPLPDRGFVPRVLGLAHLALRLAAVVMVVMLASRLLPIWLRPALLLSIAAVAIAIGFGAVWSILPDIVGGIVLLTEGRLRPGLWIVGDGFCGTVEQVGPRLTLLRAPDGSLASVPNRHLVKAPIHATDRRWHEIEVELTAPPGFDAAHIRRAIEDAVLCSPYIPPNPALSLMRDPSTPERWRLRARLLDASYRPHFEGQLLERIEEALATEAPRPVDDEAPRET